MSDKHGWRWALIFGALAALWIAVANAAETLPGPIQAYVVRVVDGDTIVVRAQVWLNQSVEESLRIDGMDAPEMRGQCAEEIRDAKIATAALKAMIVGKDVTLHNVRRDKYGRLLASVESNGVDVAQAMIGAKHARPYDGGKRGSWCR